MRFRRPLERYYTKAQISSFHRCPKKQLITAGILDLLLITVSTCRQSIVSARYSAQIPWCVPWRWKTCEQNRSYSHRHVKPVAQRSARIPFHWAPTVEAELQKLLNFERWLHRTCWKWTDTMDIANSMRPKEKPRWNSCVCVCVLMEANETIVRERHLMHLMNLLPA